MVADLRQETSSERMPFSRRSPSAIGSPATDRGRLPMPGGYVPARKNGEGLAVSTPAPPAGLVTLGRLGN